MKDVQIIDNGAVHNAGSEFSVLIEEVKAHDRVSNSSWYELTEKAYGQWLEFNSEGRITWER